MSNMTDAIIDLFALSLCAWGIYGLYASFSIGCFIVKRYEEETGLLNTVFFKNHVPFARYLPNFFSSEIYAGHLIMCLWGWRLFGKKKVFKDIMEPNEITKHFTEKEIKKVKRYGFAVIVFVIHLFVYCLFWLS